MLSSFLTVSEALLRVLSVLAAARLGVGIRCPSRSSPAIVGGAGTASAHPRLVHLSPLASWPVTTSLRAAGTAPTSSRTGSCDRRRALPAEGAYPRLRGCSGAGRRTRHEAARDARAQQALRASTPSPPRSDTGGRRGGRAHRSERAARHGLQLLSGFLRPTREIRFRGRSLLGLKPHTILPARTGAHVQIVRVPAPERARQRHGRRARTASGRRARRASWRARSSERVGLGRRLRSPPPTHAGERKRLELARAPRHGARRCCCSTR